jgi:hypothetical protein
LSSFFIAKAQSSQSKRIVFNRRGAEYAEDFDFIVGAASAASFQRVREMFAAEAAPTKTLRNLCVSAVNKRLYSCFTPFVSLR